MEDEGYRETIAFLAGRVETLEQILRVTISTLTDAQREFVYDAAREYATRTREIADQKDTDRRRDFADAAYDYSERIRNGIDDWGAHFDEINGR